MDTAHWQDRLDVLAAKHGVVGASLAVAHGQEHVAVATGVLNLRTQHPATPDSVFQIGSITKVWTAVLVMQLVDEGLLDLDAPVRSYLPDFRTADEQTSAGVTARHLLNHTSGIDGDLFLDTGRGDDALERYVAAMADLRPVHPLGATMSYCNSGYSLLGRLVEVLRGATWDAVVKERLLLPLGLESAGSLPEEALLWGAATGHVQPPGADAPVVTPQWGIYRSAGPAGLLHMPARDLLTFARAVLDGGVAPDGTRVLSQESVDAMLRPEVDVPDRWTLGGQWGLGWILFDWDGRALFGHDGATLGQGAFLRVLPGDMPVTVALCCNGGSGMRELYEDLFDEVLDALAGVRVPHRLEPVDGVVEDASRYTGTYAREGVQMDVVVGDAGALELRTTLTSPLAASMPQPPPMPLHPSSAGGDVLVTRADDDGAWTAAVFFDLAGERYVHFGARATRRTG